MTPPLKPQRSNTPPAPPRATRRAGLFRAPLILLLVALAVLGAALLLGIRTITGKNVILIVEGVRQEARTNQPTVTAFLAELPMVIEPQDIVSPPGETPIRDGMTVTIDKAQHVLIEADGQRRRLLTHLTQPAEILSEAGVRVGSHDVLLVDGEALRSGAYSATPGTIQVFRALTLQLEDDGKTSTLYSTARTVGGVLYEAGVSLYLADMVRPGLGAPVSDGSTITVLRSVPISIKVDGRSVAARTHGEIVGAALAEAGFALVGLDYSLPAESTPVRVGMTIQVVRVSEEYEIERFPIEFVKVTRSDPTLPTGTQRVIQEGAQGVRERRVRIRREDGVEVSRSMPEDVIVKTPQDQIIAVGGAGTPTPGAPATKEATR